MHVHDMILYACMYSYRLNGVGPRLSFSPPLTEAAFLYSPSFHAALRCVVSALLVLWHAPSPPPPDPPGKRDTFACGVPAARARNVQRRHEGVRSALREVCDGS